MASPPPRASAAQAQAAPIQAGPDSVAPPAGAPESVTLPPSATASAANLPTTGRDGGTASLVWVIALAVLAVPLLIVMSLLALVLTRR